MKANVLTKTSVIKVTIILAAALFLFVATSEAKEVTLHYKEWVLNANLELAPNKKITDEVILITHGGLAHRGMEIITYLQKLFKERDYNTLAINLSLGLDNRHGMYDCMTTHRHLQTDASDEIDAWVKWLKKQGTQRVILLGHSRGGLQTALYASERDTGLVDTGFIGTGLIDTGFIDTGLISNEFVKAVLLMAPATRDNSNAADYQRRFSKPLAPLLVKAQRLVDAGKADAILEHTDILSCSDTTVTAGAFISYYAADPRLDTPYLIPTIHKPTLIVIAGNDEVVVGLQHKVEPLTDGVRVQLRVIDGADHFFRDLNADDAVEAMVEFLQGTK